MNTNTVQDIEDTTEDELIVEEENDDDYLGHINKVLIGILCLMIAYATVIPMLLETETARQIREFIDFQSLLMDLYSGANSIIHKIDSRLINVVIDVFKLITGKSISE
jgi:hypothetical protein